MGGRPNREICRKDSPSNPLRMPCWLPATSALTQSGFKVQACYKNVTCRGTWVMRSVERLTLAFSSDGDLKVMRSSPALGSGLGGESA